MLAVETANPGGIYSPPPLYNETLLFSQSTHI